MIYLINFRFLQQISLSSLAVIRNVAFHTNGRVKILLDKNVLASLCKLIDADTDIDATTTNIVLSLIWALGSNNHRAKVVLQQAGITKKIREKSHKTELKRRSSGGTKREEELLEVVKNILILDKQHKS